MQVVFTKHANQNYSVVVTKGDRIKLQFQGVGKKFLIPHDISHFIVESKLDISQGFWGCVADGVLFPSINVMGGCQQPNAKSKNKQVVKAANRQLRLAECLVRIFDEIHTVKSEDVILSLARNHLQEISADILPSNLLDTTIVDICSTFRASQVSWQAMDIKESIEIDWNQNLPSKSKSKIFFESATKQESNRSKF